jgi:hypothetical protein
MNFEQKNIWIKTNCKKDIVDLLLLERFHSDKKEYYWADGIERKDYRKWI